MKEFDREELEIFNGGDEHPVYIAHDGKIYDVSKSKFWKTGVHMRRHPSGKDLTADIQAAPHGTDVLEDTPRSGCSKKSDS